ncbi:MAG: helix-turn-helix domain-containing protein [Candidatus Lutibacillus vidarii]|jgi:hypothetical protein|nr:helix-turn-helix domain-containing protein [Candidatus Lutibacillus vidarii]HON74333.1 helix-turn-helix domain-containing protein [Dermatophilaceae bacterium]HRB99489.1 helix-turn-helix domain-containing protein [Dermatophilaceae bacterium]
MAFGPLVGRDVPPEVVAGVEKVVRRMESRQLELALGVLETFDRHTPELLADDELKQTIMLSAHANLAAVVDAWRTRAVLDDLPSPQPAVDYSILAAQRGIPGQTLVYAYSLAEDYVTAELFTELRRTDLEPQIQLEVINQIHRAAAKFVAWVVRRLLEVHSAELRRGLSLRSSLLFSTVHAALRGQDVREPNFASVTGYRLAQLHLAVVAWADGESEVGMDALERTARIAAAELGGVGEPLVLPAGRQSLWAWVGLGDRRRGARVRMPSAEHLGADSTRLAIGLPDANLAGFVRSHEQAQAARKLAVEGRLADRIVWYGQEGVAIASLLRRDPVAADQWVRDVLGDLDGPDPALAELRETLRVFLTSGSSYVRTAERLTLHRNTVRYRVTRALDRLPSHTDGLLGRSTDILVALQLRALVGNHGRH